MKKNIHPKYSKLVVECRCKKTYFETCSTLQQENFQMERCVKCHNYYTQDYDRDSSRHHNSARKRQFASFKIADLTEHKSDS